MRRRTNISGRYRVLNEASLREKAKRTFDPHHRFYEAMLLIEAYEACSLRLGRTTAIGRGQNVCFGSESATQGDGHECPISPKADVQRRVAHV